MVIKKWQLCETTQPFLFKNLKIKLIIVSKVITVKKKQMF